MLLISLARLELKIYTLENKPDKIMEQQENKATDVTNRYTHIDLKSKILDEWKIKN